MSFDLASFTPHGFCLGWQPSLMGLHIVSDAVIALSYYSIPLALCVFTWKRRDLAFPWIFGLFATFILACGTTHVLAIVTLWTPIYWLDGAVKAVTALVSVVTAALLWPLMPRALALPSPADLSLYNERLRREVADRDIAARRLMESQARYRTLFVHAPIPLFAIDRDRHVCDAGNRFLEMMGYTREEMLGRSIDDFLEPGSVRTVHSEWLGIVDHGGARDLPRRLQTKTGRCLDVLVSCSVQDDAESGWRCVCAAIDVTERKRTEAALRESEERLRAAEKMTALGQLAGGVAHDFNNVLQAVLGGARLIQKRAANAAAVERLAGLIEEAAMRGASVSRRLLAFSRQDRLSAETIDVRALLAGLAEVFTHTLGSAVVIRVETPHQLAPVLADKSQLETVLVNLATNARDAMPEGGTLTFAARQDGGSFVSIAVTDTGTGMEADVLARATDPFFTTKPVGRGTGLGLAMARGFAEQSGGRLAIDSKPERGTTVTLHLPVSHGAGEPALPAGESAAATAVQTRILLVEDDPLVRETLATQLADAGCLVTEADGYAAAADALDTARPFDVLVTDFSMPDGNGLALIARMRAHRPSLPAILLTGYSGEIDDDAGYTLLRKPITGMELNREISLLVMLPSVA